MHNRRYSYWKLPIQKLVIRNEERGTKNEGLDLDVSV
jgi:hypothetical protein